MRSVVVWVVFALAGSLWSPAWGLETRHPSESTRVTASGEAVASIPDAREHAIAAALSNAVLAGVGAFVESTTIGSNYEVIKNEILVKSSGFAVLEKVESIEVKDGILRATITATVTNAPLAGRLRELGLTHEWKVGVLVPGNCSGVMGTDSSTAAETAIAGEMLAASFRLINESRRRQLAEDEMVARAVKGDKAALKAIEREYDVDVLIIGRASAEYIDQKDEGGITFYRTRGRIEVSALYTDTGEAFSIREAVGDGLDQSERLSAERCLKSMGTRIGKSLAADLMIAPASQTQFVIVKITDFPSLTSASGFSKALKDLPGVTRVSAHRFVKGTQEWDVYVRSDYRDLLAQSIESCSEGKRLGIRIDVSSKAYVQGRVTQSR